LFIAVDVWERGMNNGVSLKDEPFIAWVLLLARDQMREAGERLSADKIRYQQTRVPGIFLHAICF
jgi:hypothetical protein